MRSCTDTNTNVMKSNHNPVTFSLPLAHSTSSDTPIYEEEEEKGWKGREEEDEDDDDDDDDEEEEERGWEVKGGGGGEGMGSKGRRM